MKKKVVSKSIKLSKLLNVNVPCETEALTISKFISKRLKTFQRKVLADYKKSCKIKK